MKIQHFINLKKDAEDMLPHKIEFVYISEEVGISYLSEEIEFINFEEYQGQLRSSFFVETGLKMFGLIEINYFYIQNLYTVNITEVKDFFRQTIKTTVHFNKSASSDIIPYSRPTGYTSIMIPVYALDNTEYDLLIKGTYLHLTTLVIKLLQQIETEYDKYKNTVTLKDIVE